MQSFSWQGVDIYGRKKKGTSTAKAAQDIVAQLSHEGIAVTKIDISAQPARRIKNISRHDQSLMWEMVATLLENGLELAHALTVLAMSNRSWHHAVDAVRSKLLAGSSFAAALDAVMSLDPHVVQLIGAGEKAGALSVVLRGAAHYVRVRHEVQARVRQAALMPAITIVAAVGVLIFLCGMILPQFQQMFGAMDRPLPRMTAVVFGIANFVRAWGAMIFLVMLIMSIGLLTLARVMPHLRARCDMVLHQLHGVGRWRYEHQLMLWLHTLYIYVSAGISLKQALMHSSVQISNVMLRRDIKMVDDQVLAGASLARALQHTQLGDISPAMMALISIGENSGTLGAMLNQGLVLMQQDYQRRMQVLTNLLGPGLLVFVGGLVAIVLVAVYVPLFSFAKML